MKNLVTNVLVMVSLSLFFVPASAAVTAEGGPFMSRDTIREDTLKKDVSSQNLYFAQQENVYTAVETATLPEAVTKAAAAKYTGYTIEAAYKGSANDYKLILKKDDAKVTAYFSEAGEFVKEETVTSPAAMQG